MTQESYYKIGLGKKFLNRARIIFSIILFLFIASSSSAVYAGIKTGEIKRIFANAVKTIDQITTPWQNTTTISPAPLPWLYPTEEPIPTSAPSPAAQQYTQPIYSNCIKANIREGEFASNKCYSQQDYEDLQYYLRRYESAKLDLSSAEGFMKIDCEAAKTFDVKKSDCEKDQKDKAAAEAEVNNYRGIIQGIIAKGK